MSPMPGKRELERDVKQNIRELLTKHKWFWWNVHGSVYQKTGISDIHAVRTGVFMVIEGKRDDNEDPTALQKGFLSSVDAEGHFAFVVDGDNIHLFEQFLDCFDRAIEAQMRGMDVTPGDGANMLDAINEMTRKYKCASALTPSSSL
jgi:hypothetical protein